MSASAYASVVAGFRARVITQTKKVTKYNEDTGKPYKIQVESGELVSVEDGAFVFEEDESESLLTDDVGFCIHGRDHERPDPDCVLGIEIAETEDIMYGTHFVDLTIDKAPDEVLEFAKKHKLRPKLFLVGRCSY